MRNRSKVLYPTEQFTTDEVLRIEREYPAASLTQKIRLAQAKRLLD